MTKTVRILALLLLASPAFAQAPRTYSQPELDQMLAPVALYPDALLSQVLMAATYPVEVIEAARWSRANPGLQGDDAVRAVQDEPWDASVKSLVAFPQLLARMDEQLDWMRSLGEAFLAQEPQVMDTVQQLRQRAQAAGNLQSGEQMVVQQQGPAIVIQSASPQYVYVPYYDPLVVYGPWWWPAYRPVYWSPWPGYARPYHPGVLFSFWWGQPIGLSWNFFYGNFDWHRRQVRVVNVSNYYYTPPVIVNRAVVVDRGHWQRAPRNREAFVERRTVPVRTQVQAQPQAIRPVQTQVQAQPAAPTPVQAPAQAQPRSQPAAQPRIEQRQGRREERIAERVHERPEERREVRHAQPLTPPAMVQPQPRTVPAVVQPQPQPRTPPAVVQPQPQPRIPAAVAPQPPRIERQAQRQERGQKS